MDRQSFNFIRERQNIMHPALSVIFFTMLSGVGYGLAFFLSLSFLPIQQAKWAWGVSLVLISVGLCSSLLHLGNPQRAWRAFSQWRSSWLSREGCMAIVAFIPLCSLAVLHIFFNRTLEFVGIVGALFCVITVYCTAMIYASLKTVAQWHTYLTPICYFAFSASSGFLLLLVFAKHYTIAHLLFGFCLLSFACLVKYLWHRRAKKVLYGKSTIESATGLGQFGKVKLLEPPHTLGNYLTNEMVYRIGQKHEIILLKLMILFIFILPFIILFLPHILVPYIFLPYGTYSPLLAFLFHVFGIFLERYLFFACARHSVSLYYGKTS